ncbi:hypothetical protein ccbrp13_16840 [Ktedonobacteria bacterium brp13]|nr:hypothetical protein ccbrp13_16840 [Ktedonobacteria bacterium brp13]
MLSRLLLYLTSKRLRMLLQHTTYGLHLLLQRCCLPFPCHLDQLMQVAQLQDVQISRSGLQQRFTESAAGLCA